MLEGQRETATKAEAKGQSQGHQDKHNLDI